MYILIQLCIMINILLKKDKIKHVKVIFDSKFPYKVPKLRNFYSIYKYDIRVKLD